MNQVISKSRRAFPTHRMLIMGDLNAHTQGYYSQETNENGKLLKKMCKNEALTIAPFQGPTFERGESKTAIDYILMDREHINDLGQTDILKIERIYSDHHILHAEIANEQPA